ncbi:MAG: penicillin acylase family protein [Micrococcales bacterium]|nr:penicillin acylase family protein [Micrococcales bacterium]
MPSLPALRRTAFGALALVVAVAVVLGVLVGSMIQRPRPDYSGERSLPGLGGEVSVVRDERGVPHIYADTSADLFKAQGYANAQDRFFEMDLRRHITAGRLAELVGSAGVETDKVIRTMGWRRVAEKELPTLRPATRQYLQAYADGVNAYLSERRTPAKLGVEYVVLGQKYKDYRVERWTPADSLAWLKAMAWDLRSDYGDELARARLTGRMSSAQIRAIYPDYPFTANAPILSAQDWSPGSSAAVPQALTRTPARSGSPAGSAAYDSVTSRGADGAYAAVQRALDAVPELVGRGDGIGSNSWVVAGSRTTTGTPLLANDPHLGVGIPSIWSQVGLHCRTVSSACPFDVAGFSFAGLPGVVIGHNAKVAWAFTNLAPDVSDFYLEKVEGETYERAGAKVPLETRRETIKVAGGTEQTFTVRSTGHGPLVSEAVDTVADAGLQGASADKDPATEEFAVSLAWTGLQVDNTADAIFGLNAATDFASFREAARDFAVPSQNLLYADTSGHIGYQAPGQVPIRKAVDADSPPGFWPAPGWDPAYDWTGFVPFEDLPSVLDPKEGLLVAANQAVTAETSPFLTTEWDYGYRAQRIRELLEAKDKVSPADMAAMQTDTRNSFAPVLVKALLEVSVDDDFTRQGQDLLRGWDFSTPADGSDAGTSAAYYNAVWSQLLELAFNDELPTELRADGGSRWMQAVAGLLQRPRDAWWDSKATPGLIEGRDEILRQAMTSARLKLTREISQDPGRWQWGKLHTLTLRHQVLGGEDVPAPVRALVNRGPYSMPGGSSIVNALGWDASVGFEVDWAPSMRMVVDLGDLDRSTWVNQTGVSGHPTDDHYDDQINAWVHGEQYPWPFTREAVDKAGSDTLTLRPGKSD